MSDLKVDARIKETTGGSMHEHWTVTLWLPVEDPVERQQTINRLVDDGYRAGTIGSSKVIRFWPNALPQRHRTRVKALRAARVALREAPEGTSADVTHFQEFGRWLVSA